MKMARGKQHVFSARTTEQGLKALSALRAELKVGWDELVVEAVCSRYGLDKAMMTLPAKAGQAQEAEGGQTQGKGDEKAVQRSPEPRTEAEKTAVHASKQKGGKGKHGEQKATKGS
jgi:hypothetical protein